MTALLDTNVLLALAWPNHQHHALAHRWFSREAGRGWATCSVTELGFIRLASNPAYTSEAVRPEEAASLLSRFRDRSSHRFWRSPAACRPEIYVHAMGHQQVTDAWLVEVAIHNKGRVATLDQRMKVHDSSGKVVVVIT